MSTYRRYQPISDGIQHLYCEGCPVYIHRYQISTDLQTGERILQVRMVNMSEWEIRTVYLRVVCMDELGRSLATMYAVPVRDLRAGRGAIFGEQCLLRLSTPATRQVQVFVERVVLDSGMTWNETDGAACSTLPAPLPVRRTDADFDRLEQQAQKNGIRNDFRYQELEYAWYCTCGLPNSKGRQFCGYCGTNREWLRLNMNGRTAAVPSAPVTTEKKAPEAPPQTAKPETITPLPADSGSVAELMDYMSRESDTYAAPVAVLPAPSASDPEEEFPVIDPLPPRKNRAGKVIGILLLVLAIAAAVGFCAVRFLLPQLRYNQANELEQLGRYAEARAIFTELGTYRDAPERVTGTRYREALRQMRGGDYEAAYQTFIGISDFEDSNKYAADCLYSLGVLAFNDGDTELAWDYVQKLKNDYPDYAGAEDLFESCCYSFGNKAIQDKDFEGAKEWFAKIPSYKNTTELSDYCDYELACALRDFGDYAAAAEAFHICSYGDSDDQYAACMMKYVETNGSRTDEQTADYLNKLSALDYPGAAELYEKFYGWKVQIVVGTDAEGKQLTQCQTAESLDKLRISYSVTGGYLDETISIVLIYTLPDGATGNIVLASDVSDGMTATVAWNGLKLPACEKDGTLKLKFCNADSGEELFACDIAIAPAEKPKP